LLTVLVDLHWHLVRRTTDSLGSDFDVWLYVLDRLLENFDRWTILDLFANLFQGIIENTLCCGLLAVVHQAVDELGSEKGIVAWVRTKTCAGCCDFAHGGIDFDWLS
jgi:hypothetical protein